MDVGTCIACRGGSCVKHAVKRFIAYIGTKKRVVTDETMVEICCDRYEGMERMHKVSVTWAYCPWCATPRGIMADVSKKVPQ